MKLHNAKQKIIVEWLKYVIILELFLEQFQGSDVLPAILAIWLSYVYDMIK